MVSCFLTFRQLCFDLSAVVFCWFDSCFLIVWQLFFSVSAIVFCRFGSYFVLPDAHSRTKFNCLTAQLFGSCLLITRQLSFDFFDRCSLTFWQLFFDNSAVVFCWIESCFLIVRQLFFDFEAVVLCIPTHTVGQFSTA